MDMTPNPEPRREWSDRALVVVSWAERHRMATAAVAIGAFSIAQAFATYWVSFWAYTHGKGWLLYLWVAYGFTVTNVTLYPILVWARIGSFGIEQMAKVRHLFIIASGHHAFDAWARENGFSLHRHPITASLANTHTQAAQDAWDAAIEHCRRSGRR